MASPFNHAAEIVIKDVRESYPDLTDEEALFQAYESISPGQVRGNDEVANAYRTVLNTTHAPSHAELVDVVAQLRLDDPATGRRSDETVHLDLQQRWWVFLARRGDLYEPRPTRRELVDLVTALAQVVARLDPELESVERLPADDQAVVYRALAGVLRP